MEAEHSVMFVPQFLRLPVFWRSLWNSGARFTAEIISTCISDQSVFSWTRKLTLNWHDVPFFPQQNNINAKSSSSVQLGPEDRRSGPEHRLAHRPATLPWSQGSNVHRDGPGAFLLDLHNFPDLSKADINGQNPNIQVIMCVRASARCFFLFLT